MEFEQIKIPGSSISRPVREVIIEHHDTGFVPQHTEAVEIEDPLTVQVRR